MAKETKEEIVDEILKNPVYQPDSGVIVNLKKALLKLTFSSLHNLRMVLLFKSPSDDDREPEEVMKKFCPDCGHQTLRTIEELEDKITATCDRCGNMVHVFFSEEWMDLKRRALEPLLPEGDVDHDDEDRQAYEAEKNERRKDNY